MSHYSDNPKSVRVDFFKASSDKWYTTETLIWIDSDDLIGRSFARALDAHLSKRDDGSRRLSGMTAVCLEPYHKFSHPVMLDVDDIDSYLACGE